MEIEPVYYYYSKDRYDKILSIIATSPLDHYKIKFNEIYFPNELRIIAYIEQGNYSEALKNANELFLKNLDLKELKIISLIFFVEILSKFGNVNKAIKIFELLDNLYGPNFEEMNETRLDLLYNRCYAIHLNNISDYSNALEIYEDCLQVCRSKNYHQLERIILNEIGELLIKIGNFEEAKTVLSDLLEIGVQKQRKYIMGLAKYNLGKLYSKTGEYQKCISIEKETISIFKELNNRYRTILCYNEISVAYWRLTQIKKAKEFLTKSLHLIEKQYLPHNTAIVNNNLGLVYLDQGDYEEAILFFSNAIAIWKSINESHLAKAYNNLGISYALSNRLVNAMKYFKKGLELKIKLGKENEYLSSYINIAEVFTNQGKFSEAKDMYRKALDISQSNETMVTAIFYMNLGEINRLMGNKNTAEKYFLESLRISEEKGNEVQYGLTLSKLIVFNMEQDSIKHARLNLDKLKKLNIRDTMYHILIEISELYIRKQTKLKNEYDPILSNFENLLNYNTTASIRMFIILNIIDLKIYKIQHTGDVKLLAEINQNIKNLYSIANSQNSIRLLIQVTILDAKIKLIHLNIEKAENLLYNALLSAEENEINLLSEEIRVILSLIENKLSKLNLNKIDKSYLKYIVKDLKIGMYLNNLSRERSGKWLSEKYI